MPEKFLAPEVLVAELEDSLRWSRDHTGEKYKHAGPSEWSYQQGLLFGIASVTGEHIPDIRKQYTEKINNEPRTKKRTVKRPVQKKRVVVRRVKK